MPTRTLKIAAVLLATNLGHAALAQDTTGDALANGAQVGDWTVTCEAIAVNRTACGLTQVRVRSEGGGLLAGVVAAPIPEAAEGASITVRVPAGAWLAAGMALRPDIDGIDPLAMTWQICGPELCEAAIELDEAALTQMTDAGVAILGYAPGLGQEPLVLTIPTSGLSEGLAALR